MADKEVLREFLMSLGFEIDEHGARKFANQFLATTKLAGATSAAILGVATAAEVMVQRFASSMERLYYVSKRTGQTVDQLQALEFAAGQVGLSGKDLTAALESMAWALKRNPGLTGLLSKLGINPQSKTLLEDFVKRMSQLPLLIRSQYAEMFGIDPRMLQQLIQFMPEFLAAEEKRLKMQRESGIDADKAAEAGRNYMNTLKELWEMVTILGQKLEVELLPYFKQFAEYAKDGLQWLIKFKSVDLDLSEWHDEIKMIVDDLKQLIELVAWGYTNEAGQGLFWLLKNGAKDLAHGLLEVVGAITAIMSGNFSEVPARLGKALDYLMAGPDDWKSDAENQVDHLYGGGGKTGAMYEGSARNKIMGAIGGGQMFSRLENVYGLPTGLLDKIWNQESGRGANMTSRAGARGHFQFMPETWNEWGGGGNPDNLRDSATAAAKYMHMLLTHYGGDLQKSLAAYNWGMGNVDTQGLGKAPLETQRYVQSISGAPITINTKIEVHGANDPQATAKAIGAEQSRLYGDIVRTFPRVLH